MIPDSDMLKFILFMHRSFVTMSHHPREVEGKDYDFPSITALLARSHALWGQAESHFHALCPRSANATAITIYEGHFRSNVNVIIVAYSMLFTSKVVYHRNCQP